MAFEGAIRVIRSIISRVLGKALVRGALVMAPALAQDEIAFIDLRGKLPTNGDYPYREMERVKTIIVHHSATKGQSIQSLAEFHVHVREWPAIAYHFAVGWDGKVYQLNDVDLKTNHAAGWNTKSIGVCMVGDFQEGPLPEEEAIACERLVIYLRDMYGITSVLFHRDTRKTLCPGKYAVERLAGLKDGGVGS